MDLDNDDDDDDISDTSSRLTFGSKTLFVGNPVKRLLSRKAEESQKDESNNDDAFDTSALSIDPTANLLDDIAAIKLDQANQDYIDAIEEDTNSNHDSFFRYEDDEVFGDSSSELSPSKNDSATERIDLATIPVIEGLFPSAPDPNPHRPQRSFRQPKMRKRPTMASLSSPALSSSARASLSPASFSPTQPQVPVIQGRLRPSSRRSVEHLRVSKTTE